MDISGFYKLGSERQSRNVGTPSTTTSITWSTLSHTFTYTDTSLSFTKTNI